MELIPWNQVKAEITKLLVMGFWCHLTQIGRLFTHCFLVIRLHITLLQNKCMGQHLMTIEQSRQLVESFSSGCDFTNIFYNNTSACRQPTVCFLCHSEGNACLRVIHKSCLFRKN